MVPFPLKMNPESHLQSQEALSNALASAGTAVEALDVVCECYASYEALVKQAACRIGPKLACHSGCDTCCSMRVGAKAHEVLLLAETIRTSWTPSVRDAVIGNVASNAARVAKMTADQRYATNLPCALLIDHKCSVYLVRPLSCRRHHAKDLSTCQYAFDNPTDMKHPGSKHAELTRAIGFAESMIVEIFARQEYDQEDYELNLALHEALAAGESLQRWRDKEKTFLSAQQD